MPSSLQHEFLNSKQTTLKHIALLSDIKNTIEYKFLSHVKLTISSVRTA